MTEPERYEFDRLGYLIIPELLSAQQVGALAAAVDTLEQTAARCVDLPPRKKSAWGPDYHHNTELGFYVQGAQAPSQTLIVEDFFNASAAFDVLVDHGPTMQYITAIIQERPTINNSELRVRYSGNQTNTHMGGPLGTKYRYSFNGQGISCMMVRMIYFVHDVGLDDGAFCVVPASHKSNLAPPYAGKDPDTEPGMTGLAVNAGDGILFTENLRHGGLTNRSAAPRKTLHVGYGPFWMKSQNIATMDEEPYLLPQTAARFTEAQRGLFRAWPTLAF